MNDLVELVRALAEVRGHQWLLFGAFAAAFIGIPIGAAAVYRAPHRDESEPNEQQRAGFGVIVASFGVFFVMLSMRSCDGERYVFGAKDRLYRTTDSKPLRDDLKNLAPDDYLNDAPGQQK